MRDCQEDRGSWDLWIFKRLIFQGHLFQMGPLYRAALLRPRPDVECGSDVICGNGKRLPNPSPGVLSSLGFGGHSPQLHSSHHLTDAVGDKPFLAILDLGHTLFNTLSSGMDLV